MINSVNNISFPQIYYPKSQSSNINYYNSSLRQINFDTVEFTGKSLASEYKNVFEYLAAEILGKNKKYGNDGSILSANKIKAAVDEIWNNTIWADKYEKSNKDKIKWKNYIPEDVREYSINKINEARKERLNQWAKIISAPDDLESINPKLSKKLENNQALKLVIWDAITSEIKNNNRHIPVPFNAKALLETIERFEAISPKDRKVTCSKPSFIEYYTHRLRDNLLMEMGYSNNESTWVKIDSIKHDPQNKDKNIAKLEILSNRNWCTRSSVDKAQAALEDGDFYILLKRNKPFNIWEPIVGMTSLKGKIDQIQGKENDNIIPLNLLPEIRSFLNEKNLKCNSGIHDEGPKALQALLISDKLNEKCSESGKTFFKAIKDKHNELIFKFLNIETKPNKDGNLTIENYRPIYNLDDSKGFNIPYSMFGINEDELLENVVKINGDLVLCNRNKLYNTTISVFPTKLKSVGGNVICTQKQFDKYKDDILRVVGSDKEKIQIKWSY